MEEISRTMACAIRQFRARGARHAILYYRFMGSVQVKMKGVMVHMVLLFRQGTRSLHINVMGRGSDARGNAFSRSLHASRIGISIRVSVIQVESVHAVSGSGSARISRLQFHHGY